MGGLIIAGIVSAMLLGAVATSYHMGFGAGASEHEAAAQAAALKRAQVTVRLRTKDLETARQLTESVNATLEARTAKASEQVKQIQNSHAVAVRDRDRAMNMAADAIQKTEEMSCPEPPKRCAWDCTLPPLQSP